MKTKIISSVMKGLKLCCDVTCICPKMIRDCFCSLRVCISLFFFVTLTLLGVGLLTMSSVISSNSVGVVLEKKQALIGAYIKQFTLPWLGQGKIFVDHQIDYLSYKENHFSSMNFYDDDPSVDEFGVWLYSLFKRTNNVNFIGFGNDLGTEIFGIQDVMLLTYQSEHDNPCCAYNATHVPGAIYRIEVLENANWTAVESDPLYPSYEFRNYEIGWYYLSKNTPSVEYLWTHSVREDTYYSTISKNYYDKNGDFRGVVAVGFTLEAFKVMLTEFVDDIAKGGLMFLVDTVAEVLVATSNESVALGIDKVVDGVETNSRVIPHKSDNDDVRIVSEYLIEEYGSYSNIPTIDKAVKIGSRLAIVQSLDIDGFNVMFVHVEGYYEVYGDIFIGIFGIAVPIGIVSIILLSCFTMCSICVITYPLFGLIRKMKKVEKMKLDNISYCCLSPFYEVGTIQRKFLILVERLKEYKAFLPAHLLEEEDAKSDIGDDSSYNSSQHASSDHGSKSSKNSKNGKRGIRVVHSKSLDNITSDSASSAISECSLNSQGSVSMNVMTLVKSSTKGKFDIGVRLILGNITLVFFRLHNIDHFMRANGNEDFESFSERLFEGALGCVRRNRGDCLSHSIEKWVVIFKRTETACRFSKEMHELISELRGKFYSNLGFNLVIHRTNSCSVFEGVAGCKSVRKRVMFGEEYDFAEELCTYYSRKYDTVITESAARDVRKLYQMKPVDIQRINFLGQDQKVVLYHLQSKIEEKENEWMYELAEKEKSSRYEDLESCYNHLLRGGLENLKIARKGFEKYHEKTKDKSALNMMYKCERETRKLESSRVLQKVGSTEEKKEGEEDNEGGEKEGKDGLPGKLKDQE